MSRLASRVKQLEGGHSEMTAVWAVVPDGWSRAKQEAEARRLAEERGFKPPFSFILLGGMSEMAELLYACVPIDAKTVWEATGRKNAGPAGGAEFDE